MVLKILLEQGFCPLTIKITQFPDGFHLNCDVWQGEHQESPESSSLETESSSESQDGSLSDGSDSSSGSSFTTSVNGPYVTGKVNFYLTPTF